MEKKEEKKGFFEKLLDLLDKKLEEKAKKTGCCGSNVKKQDPLDGGTCCG